MKLKMKKVAFEGWKNCVEIASGDFRLIVTTDVGPRIIGGFLGKNGKNIFHVDPKLAGKSGGDKWVNYGGHRLWHSPEIKERTYVPDNDPIQVVKLGDDGVSFIMEEPECTGLTKTLDIFPLGDNAFRIEHGIENDGLWAMECAPWAISVMAPGGTAVVPQNPETTGLLPSKFMAVWPYTKMNDSRITWGDQFVMVKQKSAKGTKPLKIGMNCEGGWIAYINNGLAFTKSAEFYTDEVYPDNNCNVEIYTCADMLEAETLGPLCRLEPGDKVVHTEIWTLFPVDGSVKNEKDAAKLLGID